MSLFKKRHREIEKAHGCKSGSLKDAVNWLRKNKHDIKEVAKGCEDYCKVYPNINYAVAFNLYVSYLKNPKK